MVKSNQMKKVAFLINKTIKRYSSVVREIEQTFIDCADIRILSSEYGGHIELHAADAVKDGCKYIIAVGGDGTINETLNGILSCFKKGNGIGPTEYDWDKVAEIRFGLLPRGTGNDFARFFQMKPGIHELKRKILDDRIRKIDCGWTSYTGIDQQATERFFMNITDVGMGGDTAQELAKNRISWLGPNLNYMKAIVSSFVTYERTKVCWTSEADSWEGNVMSVVVANGGYFGSGLGVAPDAKIDDGLFSLVTLGNINMFDYIKNLKRIRESKRILHKEVRYDQVQKVTLEPVDNQPLPIDMDGDFVGYCPMTLECIKEVVSFLL